MVRAILLACTLVMTGPMFARLHVAADEQPWREVAQKRIEDALRGTWRHTSAEVSATEPPAQNEEPSHASAKVDIVEMVAAGESGATCRDNRVGDPRFNTLLSKQTDGSPVEMAARAEHTPSQPVNSVIVTGTTAPEAVSPSTSAAISDGAVKLSPRKLGRWRRANRHTRLYRSDDFFEIKPIDWVWHTMHTS